jgi:uncharacterized protein (TIGR03085 family)
MSTAQRERAALVKTMRDTGPDHPTLCGEWTNRELAAHLVVRERRLDAGPGILIPAFADYTERVTRQVAAETDWNVLLDKIASGPPLLSPFKLLDAVANVSEMFIHHEDIRRAVPGWEPRDLDGDTTAAIAKQVPLMARMGLKGAPGQVVLRTPDGKTLATVGSGAAVVVTGAPLELLMFGSGRNEARVELSGDDAAVAAVREGRGGV